MSKSRRLSSASAHCHPIRLDWRPSLQVTAILATLTVLAPFSLIASDLPAGWGIGLAATALTAGVRGMRRYARRSPSAFVVPLRGAVTRNGQPLSGFEVRWRGPLAFLRWHEPGQGPRHLAFFPDILDAGARRELRLAMQQRQAPEALSVPARRGQAQAPG